MIQSFYCIKDKVYFITGANHYFICNQMSSLKQLTEDATTDRQDIRSKVIAHLKTYLFFVFYQPSTVHPHHPVLQHMQFKLRDERAGSSSEGRNQGNRVVQIQFYNLDEEGERAQGLLDLKQGGLESKSKIVAYCEEERLMGLLDSAARIELDLSNIPIILTYSHPHSDFAIFAGWNDTHLGDLSTMSVSQLEILSKRWIQSAQEKVDVWSVSIKLHEEGRLQKQVGKGFEAVQTDSLFEKRFLSHVSLGYHARLSKSYNERCHEPERKTVNRIIYGWESFKNFCCLKSSNMRTSTGIVNINYVDQKGETLEILKHLREYQGSEESQVEASRVIRTDKGILSLLVTNIDRFHGSKFDEKVNCKPGDGRAEIVVFEGVKKCRRLASVGNEILLKIESQTAVQVQIGQAVYRCWGCKQLRIRQSGRIKISINKEVLEC